MDEPIMGDAAGVPFVALPPPGAGPAPLVVAWHLADPPRTDVAMAAALPLAGLRAWRVYLGLPMSGRRALPGGDEEFYARAYAEPVLNSLVPQAADAAAEFPAALAALRERFDVGDGPVGMLGGSIGAAAAGLAAIESGAQVAGLALVSPVTQLRTAVAANERRFGVTYSWGAEASGWADRLDLVARADELAARVGSVLLVLGEQDAPEFGQSARELREVLAARYGDGSRARFVEVPGMGHDLAEQPGTEAAPQTADARTVDAELVAFFAEVLAG